ncbi:hypothetical protein F5Y19DRAFT_493339 [Xylariaceae sp. FL1651]|nr:hypothetical protein F5Y19DRAFT_493339 [Xylariaceae sp. FL1651]
MDYFDEQPSPWPYGNGPASHPIQNVSYAAPEPYQAIESMPPFAPYFQPQFGGYQPMLRPGADFSFYQNYASAYPEGPLISASTAASDSIHPGSIHSQMPLDPSLIPSCSPVNFQPQLPIHSQMPLDPSLMASCNPMNFQPQLPLTYGPYQINKSTASPTKRGRKKKPPKARANRRQQPRRATKKGREVVKALLPCEEISQPLSKLTENSATDPMADVVEFTRRSPEERLNFQRHKGKIPRPLNAFLLYRRAYYKQILRMIGVRTVQSISRIAALSWRLEDQEVRDRFHELSNVERGNHESAFPNYKFLLKPRAKQVKGNGSENEDEYEDEDDESKDCTWFPSGPGFGYC